jgi:hypothetical protein
MASVRPCFRLFIAALIFCVSLPAYSQQPKTDKELLDSLLANDPLLRELDSMTNSTSYGLVSVGFGNKIFSMRNNTLNTLQGDARLVVTPSLSYFHKSGLGLSASGSMFNDTGKFAFYQYSITPSFDYIRKNFSAGISYTRYLVEEQYSHLSSPLQNDFYSYAVYKKPWLQPSIAFGYADGKMQEIARYDTVIGPRTVKVVDTIRTTLKSISVTAGVEHSFNAYEIFTNSDAFSIRPQLLLNMGSNKYDATVTSSVTTIHPSKKKSGRIDRYSEESDNSGLKFQSIAFALSADYSIKNFFIKPLAYFDYYLPSTTSDRLTTVFNITVGYSF